MSAIRLALETFLDTTPNAANETLSSTTRCSKRKIADSTQDSLPVGKRVHSQSIRTLSSAYDTVRKRDGKKPAGTWKPGRKALHAAIIVDIQLAVAFSLKSSNHMFAGVFEIEQETGI
jgi:hypothetical protein